MGGVLDGRRGSARADVTAARAFRRSPNAATGQRDWLASPVRRRDTAPAVRKGPMVTVEFAASLRRHVACAPQNVAAVSLRVVLEAALATALEWHGSLMRTCSLPSLAALAHKIQPCTHGCHLRGNTLFWRGARAVRIDLGGGGVARTGEAGAQAQRLHGVPDDAMRHQG